MSSLPDAGRGGEHLFIVGRTVLKRAREARRRRRWRRRRAAERQAAGTVGVAELDGRTLATLRAITGRRRSSASQGRSAGLNATVCDSARRFFPTYYPWSKMKMWCPNADRIRRPNRSVSSSVSKSHRRAACDFPHRRQPASEHDVAEIFRPGEEGREAVGQRHPHGSSGRFRGKCAWRRFFFFLSIENRKPGKIRPNFSAAVFVFFPLQLQRQLNLLTRRQVLPTLGTALRQWTNLCEKPPTGFEKYYDKNKNSKGDKKSDGPAGRPNAFDKAFKKSINRMSQG